MRVKYLDGDGPAVLRDALVNLRVARRSAAREPWRGLVERGLRRAEYAATGPSRCDLLSHIPRPFSVDTLLVPFYLTYSGCGDRATCLIAAP